MSCELSSLLTVKTLTGMTTDVYPREKLLKLNTHTIAASGFRASDFFKARRARVCGSNGGHTR
jgi:hypothetical protein